MTTTHPTTLAPTALDGWAVEFLSSGATRSGPWRIAAVFDLLRARRTDGTLALPPRAAHPGHPPCPRAPAAPVRTVRIPAELLSAPCYEPVLVPAAMIPAAMIPVPTTPVAMTPAAGPWVRAPRDPALVPIGVGAGDPTGHRDG
ncbi:hypothetical protein [Pseudonocardia sp. GCM10023141]|uniref:hypothetical protein n=1 Tax=Pseudonocardia sp. GCM10023141 TaxID=3252653 RepID=UPI00362456FC